MWPGNRVPMSVVYRLAENRTLRTLRCNARLLILCSLHGRERAELQGSQHVIALKVRIIRQYLVEGHAS